MSEYHKQSIQNDEISLRDLILLGQKYFYILLKSWWIIGLSGILIGGLFLYIAIKADTTYTATLSYTSAEGSGLSGLAGGLVGRFLGGGKGVNQIAKIQAMASTRKIAQMTLFQKVMIDDKYDFLINHHGRIYELEDFISFTNEKLETEEERSLFFKVVRMINKGLMSQSFDEDNGIATLSITSISEAYAINLSNEYFHSLVKFYTDTEVGEQQKTLEALEFRADSIYNAIQSTAYKIAKFKDTDNGIFRAVDKVPEAQATTELKFLSAAFEVIVQNLETIKFTVASNTPSIRAIDYPMTPIKPKAESKIIRTITGGFIGGFIASIFILGRTIFREIMKEDEEQEVEIN